MSDFVDKYKTIKGEIKSEFEEEKSIFKTSISYVENEEDALSFIEKIKKENPQANHNCYAYILNMTPEIKRYSDDGEPQGTAGLPMLSVLEKEGLKNVVAVVTRYFGGKKLGKGGLVRAYTRGVSDALKNETTFKSPFYRVELTNAYTIFGQIENYLIKNNFKIIEKEFAEDVKIILYIKKDDFEKFKKELIDLTSANIKIEIKNRLMLFED